MNAVGLRLLLVPLLLAAARPALAQGKRPPAPVEKPADGKPVDKKTLLVVAAEGREAARTLAERGYELFERGQWAQALEAFRFAEDRFHAPTHWLYIARSFDRLGKLLESRDAYNRVLEDKLAPDAPGPFRDAKASAIDEVAAVVARIPTLTVAVTGLLASGARVTLDAAPLRPDALGQPQALDPGEHTVEVTVGEQPPLLRVVAVKEKTSERLVVALDAPRGGSYAPAIAAFGVGLAALGAGAGLGFTSLAKTRGLPAGCPPACGAADHATASTASTLGTAGIVALVAGGVAVGAGTVLLLVRAPSPPRSGGLAGGLRVGLGPGSITLSGEL